MSNTLGHVVYKDQVMGYFEYHGSSDVASSIFYETEEEVLANWRSGRQGVCIAPVSAVPVLLWTEYGGGFYWPSMACWFCMAITGERSPYWGNLDIDEWPRDGHPLGPEFETDWARLCDGNPLRNGGFSTN